MRNAWCVCKRELRTYFSSPLAYALLAVFALLNGYFFSLMALGGPYADMRTVFANMAVISLFVVPAFTMRLWPDERRQGTDELLLTAPARVGEIVVGKYLAALLLLAAMLLSTGLYPAILERYGNLEWTPVLTGYLGMFLLGAGFVAMGLFAATLTDSAVVASLAGFGLLLLSWVIGWLGDSLRGTAAEVLRRLSMIEHLLDFQRGVLDLTHVTFYLSVAAAFVFLAVRMVERRRWL